MKARKVNKSTLDVFSKHVDVEDIYITRTIEQSDKSLDEIIEKRYPLVMCGGGDGTAMRIIEQMRLKVDAHNKAGGDYQMPKFGLLKLGTGNGWAGLVKSPPKVEPIWAIRRFSEQELPFRKFNMMESEGRLFHFGGFGVDALILNDYIDLKSKFTEGFGWKMVNSLPGYVFAIITKSIPHVVFKGFKMNIRVTNMSDDPVYRCSYSEGTKELEIKKGETIFEGPSIICAFGTTSNYGFGLKVFPYALDKDGYMNLRVGNPAVPTILSNIKGVWQGTWEDPNLNDFLVKDIKIEVENDAPYQLGGDPEGYFKEAKVNVSDYEVEVLDFSQLRALPKPE